MLVGKALWHDLAEIYTLTMSDLENVAGWGEISARNIITAVAAAKKPTLARFIYGLGIRHIGSKTASDLAKHFASLEKIKNATEDELLAVDGVGKIVAQSLLAWFADEDNLKLLEKFHSVGVEPYAEKIGAKLAGQSFAITGTLTTMSRDDAAEKIRLLGGEFQNSVGKSTTYLVAGGKIGASKRAAAEKFGTKILNETELLEMLG
jgi:DNA ligase (NAD+)